MKKSKCLVITLLVAYLAAGQSAFSVMTFNIRLNLASDSLNAWPYRKDKVASQVLFHKPAILGVQEALHEQMVDLAGSLRGYRSVGGGRDDGKEKGEASAIFYDTARLQLLKTDMFWLSEAPDKPGIKGWDAAYPRIVTWAQFRDKKTKKIFFAFNTHFDHMGKIARRESAKMILQRVYSIAGKYPAVITGDFNAGPADEPVQLIVNKADPLHLVDAKELSRAPHYGPAGTFNGFGAKEVNDQPIDYIFLKGKWQVYTHATISQTWGGLFASDHFAVLAELALY